MVSEKKENIIWGNTSYSFSWNSIVLKWYSSDLSNNSVKQEILFVFSSQTILLFIPNSIVIEKYSSVFFGNWKMFVSYLYQ